VHDSILIIGTGRLDNWFCLCDIARMPTLAEKLLAKEVRPKVVVDAAAVVDGEVHDKSGLSGLAIKAAYGVVKAVKPGIIPEVLDSMLDDFVARLEPFYADWQQRTETPFSEFIASRAGPVADALLSISDERASRSKNATLKKAYEKLRPTGKKHVEAAVPRLGRMVQIHLK
jgi:hypothetical protein